MRKVTISELPEEEVNSPLFVGHVTSQTPVTAEDSDDVSINYVHFHEGARNKFHTHTSDQVLIATEGRGMFATQTEKVEFVQGDVIFSPAGEVHKHGAVDGEEFTHISITRANSTLNQIED